MIINIGTGMTEGTTLWISYDYCLNSTEYVLNRTTGIVHFQQNNWKPLEQNH
jgi:hypothetical protein